MSREAERQRRDDPGIGRWIDLPHQCTCGGDLERIPPKLYGPWQCTECGKVYQAHYGGRPEVK